MVPRLTLNFMRMVIIKVFANLEAQATNSRLFERRINWDPSIRFPLEETIKVLKMLFGSDVLVDLLIE